MSRFEYCMIGSAKTRTPMSSNSNKLTQSSKKMSLRIANS